MASSHSAAIHSRSAPAVPNSPITFDLHLSCLLERVRASNPTAGFRLRGILSTAALCLFLQIGFERQLSYWGCAIRVFARSSNGRRQKH
jgi:hypothetical protein